MSNQKGEVSLITIAIMALIVILFSALAFYVGANYFIPKEEPVVKLYPSISPSETSGTTTGPSVSAKPTSTPDETADWNTYRNEEYGFEIKYPKDLQSEFTNNEVKIFSIPTSCEADGVKGKIEGNEIKITIKQYSGLSFEQTWKNILGFDFSKDSYDGSEMISGKTAYYFAVGAEMPFGVINYLVEQAPKKIINIRVYTPITVKNCNPPLIKSPNEILIANQILSTFKFTEKDETADWKTYKNDEFGFEVKYPKEFYAKESYLTAWLKTNGIITISSNDKFEKEASSLLLSIENIDDFDKIIATNDDTKEMVTNNLGLDLSKKSLNTEVVGTFAGDPPWDYYLVYIKIPNVENKGLLLTARIYQADHPGYGGTNSDLKLSKLMLSTFKFTEKDETVDWKTYKNEKYGLEVKYPSKNWKAEENNGEIFIGSSEWRNDMPEGGRSVQIKTVDITLKDFNANYNSENKEFCDGKGILKEESFTIDDSKGTKLTGCTAIGIDTNFIFVERSNKKYLIEYQDYDPIHKQMLSTFKFTK